MKLPERPDTETLSHFTFGSEPSFELVRTDGEANERILNTVKRVDIELEKGPHEVLKAATNLIDEAIAEGKVHSSEREKLIQGARIAYFITFS